MKTLKKTVGIIAIVICFSMIFSQSVFAGSPAIEEDYYYSVIYSAEEIEDVETLTEMAESGLYVAPEMPQSYSVLSNGETEKSNTVHQLLTKKQYRNGDIVSEYVASTVISKNTIIQSNESNSDVLGETVAIHKFYYSFYVDYVGVNPVTYVKPAYISTKITNKSSLESVSFEHKYNFYWDLGVYRLTDTATVNYPAIGKEYLLFVNAQNGVSPKYIKVNNNDSEIYSGCILTVNGSSIEFDVDVLERFVS